MAFEETQGSFAREDLPPMGSIEGIDPSAGWTDEGMIKAGKECVNSFKPKKQQRTGRKQTKGSEQLSGILTSKNKPLKTEYKRCQFIRLIMKMSRELSNFKYSKKFLNEYRVTSEENRHLLLELQKIYRDNQEHFDSIKETICGPATDGKNKRKRETTAQPKERSFNKAFCRQFYIPECVREFHAVLVELIYGRIDEVEPTVLCKKFNEFCCFKTEHTMECVGKWRNVLKYMNKTLIEDLDLEPVLEVSYRSECTNFPELTPEHFVELDEAELFAHKR